MEINVGFYDSVLRIVLGLVLVGMAATGMIGIWGWIGVVALATGLLSRCPIYSILGIDTSVRKR